MVTMTYLACFAYVVTGILKTLMILILYKLDTEVSCVFNSEVVKNTNLTFMLENIKCMFMGCHEVSAMFYRILMYYLYTGILHYNTDDEDYTLDAFEIIIPAGPISNTGCIAVSAINDYLVEGNHSFIIILTETAHEEVAVGSPHITMVTIIDAYGIIILCITSVYVYVKNIFRVCLDRI